MNMPHRKIFHGNQPSSIVIKECHIDVTGKTLMRLGLRIWRIPTQICNNTENVTMIWRNNEMILILSSPRSLSSCSVEKIVGYVIHYPCYFWWNGDIFRPDLCQGEYRIALNRFLELPKCHIKHCYIVLFRSQYELRRNPFKMVPWSHRGMGLFFASLDFWGVSTDFPWIPPFLLW